MVKRLPNWLKIGVQAGFGPDFTMEFEAEIPKKFGLAYCTNTRTVRPFTFRSVLPGGYDMKRKLWGRMEHNARENG